MSIEEALKTLYDKEINCSITSFWDGQWDVRIGDEINGFKTPTTEVKIDQIADTLIELAKKTHPHEQWD